MRYLSVCSGIEAASAAWHDLGWTPVAFSEIEPFPSAVLAQRFPSIPNWGDMTKFKEWPDADVDVLVGGTPCQSFSVAGLRKGLDDPRGSLMLVFLAIAARYRPRYVVWENVPGVLSSGGGRDFGSFLGALGELGYGWAYRVLDAQWFGVAQRRRRVFVVGCLGDQRRAAQVLFEREGVCRDPAPRREAREGSAAGTAARPRGGGGIGTDAELDGALIPEIAACLETTSHDYSRADGLTMIAHAIQAGALRENPASGPDGIGVQADIAYTLEARAEVQAVAHALRGEGFDASEDGTGRGTPLVPVAQPYTLAIRGRGETHNLEYRQDGTANALLTPNGGRGGIGVGAIAHAFAQPVMFSIMPMNSGKDFKAREVEVAQPLMASGPGGGNQGGDYVAQPVAHAFDARQSDVLQYGDRTGPLDTDGHSVAVAFSCKDHGADAASDVAPTLRAMGHASSHANGGGQMAVAFEENFHAVREVDIAPAMTTEGYRVSQNAGGLGLRQAMQVRRLTPRECERLQGFPDDYTAIPWRGKPASDCPDGPRYKALGNSMAVPVMRWIGERIAAIESKRQRDEAREALETKP